MAAYGFFRTPISGYDLTVRPARTAVYIEGLNHSILTHAMIVALCKSVDFLLGFAVGTTSDNISTRWGRRKPWVVVCFPLAIVSMFLLVAPFPFATSAVTGGKESDVPCTDLVHESMHASCPALKACLDDAQANASLPVWNHVGLETENPPAGAGLSVWFAVTYFSYYFFSWTCTMIPYDALGMELTSDYSSRVNLFSVKVLFNFAGYIVPNVAGLVLAKMYPTDIISVYAYTAVILGVLSVVALVILMGCISERPDARTGEGNNVPAVVSIRRAMNNKPYRIYLAMKVPISIVGLIPVNMVPYLLRYGMRFEDWSEFYFTFLIIVLITAFLCTPAVAAAMRRFGKRNVLLYAAGVTWPFFLGAFFWHPESMPMPVLYLIGAVCGLAAVLTFAAMDSMLADVIDYDTLHTGKRSEGVYTVAETNLQQFIEVFAGVVPLLIMNAVGFENNGGCSCGCGVACEEPFERWKCPGDIAYACTSDFTSVPLYGDPFRTAPCVIQSSEGTVWVVRGFLFLLSSICLLTTFALAKLYPITRDVHAKILEATEALNEGRPANDPITGLPVVRKDSTEASLMAEHFTTTENAKRGKLVQHLTLRLGLWIGIFVSFIVAMTATDGDAQQYVVSLCAICCSAIFVLVPYDAIRLKVARQMTTPAVAQSPPVRT